MDLRALNRLRDEAAKASGKREAATIAQLTDEWFPEERAFFDDPGQLAAACCGRRAGKTRGVVRDLVRDLTTVPGARLLYLNTTRGEAETIAWWGNRGDGVAALNQSLGLGLKLDQSDLTAYCKETDGWLYLRGADDEAELRKRLGGAYHKVYWDEAQKIPSKLNLPIKEVFMPALLDFGGTLRFTGSPSRELSSFFYGITRPDVSRRVPGWNVYHWNLLANPFFGKDHDARWKRGILGLQKLYGGPDVAPIDSPLMQREAFGRWVHEDAAYVYAVHRVPERELFYAPHRARADGFVDVAAALADLPWSAGGKVDLSSCFFALGADLGYRDPFALVLWAWHPHDPVLYEVCSWKKSGMVADEQNAALRAVMEVVRVGLVVADAGGPAQSTVKGWSKEWIERYSLPILEAEKQHKHTAVETWNGDILTRRCRLREGSPLYAEMSELQWTNIVSGTGRMVEDPTQDNHCCDAALYAHRHSYQYRSRPEDVPPPPGSREARIREEAALEEDMLRDEDDSGYGYH